MKSIKNKQELRENITSLKSRHSKDILSNLSKEICRKLEENSLFLNASCVALYYSIGSEVNTREFIEKWYKKKKIVLPVIRENDLFFYLYNGKESLYKGQMNIPEPFPSGNPINIQEIDLIIVPGVAFDRECNRMGRGKGYYDRLLSTIHVPKIGIGYNFQLLDQIPVEPHDKKMDIIITETENILNESQSYQ